MVGEESRRLYTGNLASEWAYKPSMRKERSGHASAVLDGKIYVLGGVGNDGKAHKGFEVYDAAAGTWTELAEYPGNVSGIVGASMVAMRDRLYAFGGADSQTGDAKLLKDVFRYNPQGDEWTKMADMPVATVNAAVAAYGGKAYCFGEAGGVESVDVFDPASDEWTGSTKTASSGVVQAYTVDGNKLLVFREVVDGAYFQEYLPDSDTYGEKFPICPFEGAELHDAGTVVNGKIHMVRRDAADRPIYYDTYSREWGELGSFHIAKSDSAIQAVGTTLYSLGGRSGGFGVLEVVEGLTLENTQIMESQMDVSRGEAYEIQLVAGNLPVGKDGVVTLLINPEHLGLEIPTSFTAYESAGEAAGTGDESGTEGFELLDCQPQKGRFVFRVKGGLERGSTGQAYDSIPVTGLKNTKSRIKMYVEY